MVLKKPRCEGFFFFDQISRIMIKRTELSLFYIPCCMLCLFRTKHSSLKFSLNTFILGIAYNVERMRLLAF